MDNGGLPRSTRQRLVAEAIRLFAARGYDRVSVGEIEAAAGLAPRAGSFYKHFPSKRDVLAAALDDQANRLDSFQQFVNLLPLGDPRAELTLCVRWGLQEMTSLLDFHKVARREADQFPDLISRWHDSVIANAYAEVVRVMTTRFGERPAFEDQDMEALASILLGAIANYRLEENAFGIPPAGVAEERFVQTWVELCMRFLQISDRPQSPTADSAAIGGG